MIESRSDVSMVSLCDTSADVANGGFMKRFFTFVFAVILFTQNVFAETEIDPTDISFESNRKFISSLSNVLEQDFDAADVKKGLKPFNDRSVGYRAESFDTLIEKLPLASNDLIQSAKRLDILNDPKLLVKLQEEIYFSAVGTISPEAAQSARDSYRTPGLAAVALLGVGVSGGGGSGPANPQVSISVASASFSENGGSTDVTLALDRAILSDLEVTLSFTSDATDGTDYTTDATATISAGDTTTSFTVTAVDDSVYEGNETGIITIASVDQAGVDISSTNSVTITILEDETVPTVSLAASAASVSEESGSGITFTASIDQVAAVDLTVTLAVTVNSRSQSYTPNVPSSIDITIPAGSLTGSAVYTPTDNNSYDGTSNVSFAVSTVVGGGAVANTVNISTTNATETVAITETETAPTVELTALTRTVAEGGDDITLTATLTGSTYEDVTIVLARAGGATSGSDYSLANITIPAGTSSATAAFSPTADSLYEGFNELATITIDSVSGGGVTLGAANTASITITDGDSAPTVTLASSAASVSEGSSVTLTATLSVATTAAVTVPLDTSGATEGTDYGALSDIMIAAGSTTGSVTFTATDDSVYEGTETATVSIGTVSGGSASAASSGTSVVVTITDAQSAPTVVLSASAESVIEDGSAITLTATLSGVADEDVTVPIDTSGTATEGTDYSAISDITISAGSTTGTATITPTDDSISEGAETLIVSLGTLSGADATAGSTSSLTLNFVDDDVPNITLTASTTSIAENSGSSITLTVTTSMIATEDIVVSLAAAGTATSGADYTALPSSLTIAAGDTTKTASFTPTDDSLYDATSDETAIISISSVSGGNALESGDQSVTLTITDNESAPTVTLASNVASVDEDGGSATITATLSVATYEDVTIALSGAGTATPDTDYTYTSSITISAGSTTGTDTLTSTADDLYDAASNETAIISVASVSGGGATESGTQSETITITDAESAPTVTLAVSDTTVSEDGGTSTITATLSGKTFEDVTVSLSATGTAIDDTDYTYGGSITISQGALTGTDTLTSTADDLYDAASNETAIISVASVSGGGATESGTQSETITITDAESAPTVTLEVSSNTIAENSSNAIEVKARLSHASYEPITVSLTSTGADATVVADTDYQAPSSITIAANTVLSSASSFTSLDDASNPVYEENEAVTLAISGVVSGSASLGGTDSQTITISENESAPVLSLSGSTTIDESSETATITASISIKVDKALTVSFSKSGTATDVTDYSISSLSISVGATSNSSVLSPVNDTDYESGSETVVLTASAAGISGISASNSVTVTITNDALNSGTQLVYSSSNASARETDRQFTNIKYDPHSGVFNAYLSEQNPFSVINAHKAYGYGLTGNGITVLVVDNEFDLDHSELNKTGKINALNSVYNTKYRSHGTSIAGIIAADDDGVSNNSDSLVGIAPNVNLNLIDYRGLGASTLATLINSDNVSSAMNNSWGYNHSLIDDDIARMSTYGWDAYELFANYFYDNDGNPDTEISSLSSRRNYVVSYISALDDFQEHGVIVFSNSNTSSNDNAEITAALPELFSELAEAFISVVNIDVTGSSGSETYTRKSAPCGDAARYCVGADGHALTTLDGANGYTFFVDKKVGDGETSYMINTGTSYAAPQVTAAISILAEAFPNQTPEQWTDRLLASANNDIGFVHVGSVSFGNGVSHGYSSEAGHGIIDIYAALNPILTSAYTPQTLAFNATTQSSRSYSLLDTNMIVAQSFGDALLNAVKDETTYMYDALDGGFVVEMDQFLLPAIAVSKPTISVSSELGKTVLSERMKSSILRAPEKSGEKTGFFEASVQQSNKTMQKHVAEGQWNGFNDVQYMFPFLSSIQSGDGLSFGDDIGNDYISFSWNKQHSEFSDGEAKEAITMSYSTTLGTATDVQFIGGVADENEYFLGTKGSGAFDFTGADNITSFFGLKSTTPIGDDLIFSAGMALSYTDVNKPASGIITEISGVTASAFEIGVTAFNVIGNDALSLSIGQPHRVESGSAHLKIAGLENQDGTVPFVEKTASLAPSGRQIDLAMAYNFDLDQTSAVRFKMMQTFEKGHVKNADPEASLYLGYATEDVFGEDSLAFGAAFNDDRDPSLELKYSIRW